MAPEFVKLKVIVSSKICSRAATDASELIFAEERLQLKLIRSNEMEELLYVANGDGESQM